MLRKLSQTFSVVIAVLIVAAIYFLYPPAERKIEWPEGKKFAFTIIDDTDASALTRLRPLYEVLDQHGLRTTKTIWVLEGTEQSHFPNTGVSLSDPAYRDFLHEIKRKGFEIALHGVRGGSSSRADILKGLDVFRSEFGKYPELHVNHSLNKDNLYWGARRYALVPFEWIHSCLMPYRFYGDAADSEHFWGDIARQNVRYVRRYTFREINLLNINPTIPYRLESKPYVNLWFPGSDGGDINQFVQLLRKENLERLQREGGVTFVYAHLGGGSFNKEDGSPDPRFVARIRELSAREGWFAPATQILDYMKSQPGWTPELSFRETVRLDLLFLLARISL